MPHHPSASRGGLLAGAILALAFCGCTFFSEMRTEKLDSRNERQGETYRTVFRPAHARKTGMQETIVHLDADKIQFYQEIIYTPEHAAQSGIHKETIYENINGNLEKRAHFTDDWAAVKGPLERVELFNEQGKRLRMTVKYHPDHARRFGEREAVSEFDVNERKEREEIFFTAEQAAATGCASAVIYFRDGRADREIRSFSPLQTRQDGIVRMVTHYAPDGGTQAPPRVERIEVTYGEAHTRQRGIHRCVRYMDLTGGTTARTECFDRSGNPRTP